MSEFEGGPKAAAKLLASLDPEMRKRVYELMKAKDPQMAQIINDMMVQFEDIKYISVKMLQEFLREIDIKDLALGLRIGSDELKDFVLSNVSKGMKSEITDILDGPAQKKSDVLNAQNKIVKILRQKSDEGSIVFVTSEDELV